MFDKIKMGIIEVISVLHLSQYLIIKETSQLRLNIELYKTKTHINSPQ